MRPQSTRKEDSSGLQILSSSSNHCLCNGHQRLPVEMEVDAVAIQPWQDSGSRLAQVPTSNMEQPESTDAQHEHRDQGAALPRRARRRQLLFGLG